jgi:FLVCR family feline leukemia virus subgroup C receptor-related protein
MMYSLVLPLQGLRASVLLGALGTAGGSWIKVASASPDLFVVAFVGQTVVAMSQVFVLSVPARLAAVWFGQHEVSSACSIGVFGNQVRHCVLHVSSTPILRCLIATDMTVA